MTIDQFLSAFGLSGVDPDSSLLLLPITLLALLIVLSLPLVITVMRDRRIDVLSPLVMFTLVVSTGFILPIAAYWDGADLFSKYWPYSYTQKHASIIKALWLCTLASFSFSTAFLLATRRSRRPRVRHLMVWDVNLSRWRTVAVWYTVLGLSLFGLGVYLQGGLGAYIGGLGNRVLAGAGHFYLLSAIQLLPVVALLWFYLQIRRKRLRDPMLVVYVLFTLLAEATQGNKSTFIIPAIAAATLYHYGYRAIRIRTVAFVVIFTPVLLGFYDLVVREYLQLGYFVTVDVSSFTTHPMDVVLQTADIAVTGNFVMLQATTVAVEAVPEILPLQYGGTYTPLLTALLPRVWFPDKVDSALFSRTVWPGRWAREGTTMPSGLIAEFYINFGIPGVILGSLMMGWLFGWSYTKAMSANPESGWFLGYALAVGALMHFLRGELAAAVIAVLLFAIPLLLAWRLIARPKRRFQEVTAPPAQTQFAYVHGVETARLTQRLP